MAAASDDEVAAILETLNVEDRVAIAEALIGDDTIEFFRSDVGRTMVGLAKQEYVIALLELEKVAWWRRRRIRELQNQAWRARSFVSWLQELVLKGHQAAKMITEEEGESNE